MIWQFSAFKICKNSWKSNFRASECVKIVNFALLESLKLISRKIWMIKKCWFSQTVYFMVQWLISGINEQHLVNKAISELDILVLKKIIIIPLLCYWHFWPHSNGYQEKAIKKETNQEGKLKRVLFVTCHCFINLFILVYSVFCSARPKMTL